MALIKEPFSGYYHREVPEHDRELTEVGPGTPCGNICAASGTRSG